MKITDLMTKNVITANIKDSLYDIAVTMMKYDIGFVPIVKDKKIVGVLTDRDIVIKAISNSSNTNHEIENYYTSRIIYLDVNRSIDEALKLMGRQRVKRILITEDNKVIGVLSFSDILLHYSNTGLIIETLKQIYQIDRNQDRFRTEIDEFYL